MNIIKAKPLTPSHKGITFETKKSARYTLTLSVSGKIREIDDNLTFISTIFITPEIWLTDRSVILETEHQFQLVLGERNIKFANEHDYWNVADMIQASISQARIFLMQEADKHQLKLELLPFQPIQSIYKLVKEGNYSLWN